MHYRMLAYSPRETALTARSSQLASSYSASRGLDIAEGAVCHLCIDSQIHGTPQFPITRLKPEE